MSAKRLTKAELVEHVAAGMDMGRTQAERLVGMVFREMERKLRQGVAVSLPGIGTLTPFEAEAKKGRNPRTGEPCVVPARNRVRFRMSATLRRGLSPAAEQTDGPEAGDED